MVKFLNDYANVIIGMRDRPFKISRRSVLKTTAVGLAGVTGSTVSAAASSSPSALDVATQIRTETGDNDAFVEYLEERGFSVKTRQQEFAVPTKSSDDGSVGTMSYNDSDDLTVSFNFLERGPPGGSRDWWLDGHFEWAVSGGVRGGDRCGADDVISFHWSQGEFDLMGTEVVDGWNENRIYTHSYEHDQNVVWKFDDCGVGPGAIYNGTVRADIKAQNPNEGKFLMKYHHTWDSTSITGIQLWGLQWSNSSNKWVSDPNYVYW